MSARTSILIWAVSIGLGIHGGRAIHSAFHTDPLPEETAIQRADMGVSRPSDSEPAQWDLEGTDWRVDLLALQIARDLDAEEFRVLDLKLNLLTALAPEHPILSRIGGASASSEVPRPTSGQSDLPAGPAAREGIPAAGSPSPAEGDLWREELRFAGYHERFGRYEEALEVYRSVIRNAPRDRADEAARHLLRVEAKLLLPRTRDRR